MTEEKSLSELERLKNNLKIDHDFSDKDLEENLEVAKHYIRDAVDQSAEFEQLEKIKQFGMAARILAGHWYEHPEIRESGSKTNVPFSFLALLQQIRGRWYADNRNRPDD